jgi:hypothetical protein
VEFICGYGSPADVGGKSEWHHSDFLARTVANPEIILKNLEILAVFL